ncbi:hypothetical protein [Streptomyces sp. LPB2020-019-1HS]|uniref:hypothetical protein n=1 Tax=Streptomyces sp. LPB2020-019-1HS TaxID=3409689 RepID=UPI003B67FC41
MVALGVMFGLFAVIVVSLITVVLRRRAGVPENADGLLVEQDARLCAHGNSARPTAR